MGRWAAKPVAKFAIAGEKSVPLEPCVNIRVGDGIGVVVCTFLLLLAPTSCLSLGGFGVLDFTDEVSGDAEITQGIGLGENGRSKWCFCNILEWPFLSLTD